MDTKPINDVQIIIPMAGKSQRFFDAGYTKPKGLIEFLDLPMIGHILKTFDRFIDILIIINEDDYARFDLVNLIHSLNSSVKVVKIKQHLLGPSYSIFKAVDSIDLSKKIIVHYCDFSGAWEPTETVNLLNRYDGVFVSFKNFHPTRLNGTKFAYGKANDQNLLLSISEKKSFTSRPEEENASSGIYGFSTGYLMIESIEEQLKINLQINNEFYTSLTQEVMLRNNKKIVIQNMSLFYGWGTPEDLEMYIYYLKFYRNLSQYYIQDRSLINHNAIILAAGKSSRLRLIGEKPKQFKLISNMYKLIDFSQKLISKTTNTFLVATSETYPDNDWKLPNENVKILTHASESQLSSVQLGLGLIKNKDIPITFLASDNIVLFGGNEVELNDVDIDVIVWTSSNYPFAKISPEQYSWIKINDSDTIEDIIFKNSPKELRNWKMITGNFTFRNHATVSSLIEALNSEIEEFTHEPMLDDLVRIALKNGYSVRAFEVENYITLGTELENKVFDYFGEIYNYVY